MRKLKQLLKLFRNFQNRMQLPLDNQLQYSRDPNKRDVALIKSVSEMPAITPIEYPTHFLVNWTPVTLIRSVAPQKNQSINRRSRNQSLCAKQQSISVIFIAFSVSKSVKSPFCIECFPNKGKLLMSFQQVYRRFGARTFGAMCFLAQSAFRHTLFSASIMLLRSQHPSMFDKII